MPSGYIQDRWNLKETLLSIASTKLLKDEGEIFLPCWTIFTELRSCQEFLWLYSIESTNSESNPLFQATNSVQELSFVNKDIHEFYRLTYNNPPTMAEADKTLKTLIANKRKGAPTGGTRENPLMILDEEDRENKIVAHLATSTKTTGRITWTRAEGKIFLCDDEDSDDHALDGLSNESDSSGNEEEESTDGIVEDANSDVSGGVVDVDSDVSDEVA